MKTDKGNVEDLRFIVFILDSKIEQHDGKVFCTFQDARAFCQDCINDKYGSKFIIGSFVLTTHREMNIEFIETFGLSTSKKKLEQLDLFAGNKHAR